MSAAFSTIMITAAFKYALMIEGLTEASSTRKPSMPRSPSCKPAARPASGELAKQSERLKAEIDAFLEQVMAA
jgi:hypothetical protein